MASRGHVMPCLLAGSCVRDHVMPCILAGGGVRDERVRLVVRRGPEVRPRAPRRRQAKQGLHESTRHLPGHSGCKVSAVGSTRAFWMQDEPHIRLNNNNCLFVGSVSNVTTCCGGRRRRATCLSDSRRCRSTRSLTALTRSTSKAPCTTPAGHARGLPATAPQSC